MKILFILMFLSLTPTPKMVYVEWIDIVATDGGWHTDEELEEWIATEPDTVRQMGFLYKETKNYIVLIDSQFSRGFKGYAVKIPKGTIIKMRELK